VHDADVVDACLDSTLGVGLLPLAESTLQSPLLLTPCYT
jgi:hypothetical protein